MMTEPGPSKPKRKKPNAGATDQTSAIAIEGKERARRALEHRKAGKSYGEIAKLENFCDQSAAYKAVSREIAAITREPAIELVSLEVARLDDLLAGIWESAKQGNLEPLEAAQRIIMNRAKLLGLVTQKVEVQAPSREAMWERVGMWLAEPTPELEKILAEAGWVRSGRPMLEAHGEALPDSEAPSDLDR